MKKIGLFFIFCFITLIIFSQENKKIAIDFDEITMANAIFKLENASDYTFYYQKDWFDNTLISGEYNSDIETIIKELFKETSINYLIMDHKIILTNNSIIYNNLPDNYFNVLKKDNKEVSKDIKAPVFQKIYINDDDEITSIGKENKNSSRKTFKVSGYVKDYATKKPVQDLVIFVQGNSINTVTNKKGYYSISLPSGLNVLITKSLSYENTKKKVIVFGDGLLDFDILESAEVLDEVLIKSNRDDNIKKTVVGVTRIDIEEIKNVPLIFGERDILKVATTMPGIKTAGEGALGYNVRGGKVDQNLILFDNAVMYNPSHVFGVFSAINPFATGSVDIYKGSIPSEFGGRLSSVIDISTKEANTQKFSGEGSIGPITGNITIETPIIQDKAAILLGARTTYSDWILKTISEKSIKNSKASFYDGILKYNHKINDNNNLKVTGYYSSDNFSISSDSIYNYSNRLTSLEWDHSFNDKSNAIFQLVNSEYKFNIKYDGIFNRNFDFGYSINETQFKLIMKYLHSKKHKFKYGFGSKLYLINPGKIKPIGSESLIESKVVEKERGLESAVFISDLYEVNSKLSFDIGLRYSNYLSLGEGTQNLYNPELPKSSESIIETKHFGKNEVIKNYGGAEVRLSGRYFLSPNLSVKASYNNTLQYIHLLSTNTTASPIDSWKLSDLNIEPQRASQYSIGLFKNSDDNTYEVSVEGYYKMMKNYLDFKIGAEILLNQNIETELLQGKGKAYGTELLIKKKKGKLNGWLSYSYSRSFVKLKSQFSTDQVNNGEYFAANHDRPHDISLISNYKLTNRYSFSFNFNYQSGRPITYPVGKYIYAGTEQVLYSDRNKFRIPDYYRFDIGVNIEGNHKNVKLAHSFWNISVYNVLGRNNAYSMFFVNEKGQIKGYKTSIFSIPIPTITYNFKF